jgi:tryptophanyl-tRNA synthetase
MARIFSGIQPSGELHIGNYLGAVKNWVTLQHTAESIFCIVDYHAITGEFKPALLRSRRREMALGLLAAGIDPAVSTLFVQSDVPEHTELAWIFNSVTPLGELERQTQFKDKSQRMESVNAGLLTYPILQAADILLYRADRVPVGEDQVPHLELSREVVRRLHNFYGEVFVEPQPLLTPTPRLPGLDNRKMSKSYGNTIDLSDTAEDVVKKIRQMYTDPKRVRADIPGTVEGNPVFMYHDTFNPNRDEVEELKARYRAGKVGDVEVKTKLANAVNNRLAPLRERRAQVLAKPGYVREVLIEGSRKARAVAQDTMARVRAAVHLEY